MLRALATLSPSTHREITVATPTLHHFSPQTNTQVHADLPASLDLKTYALQHGQALTQPQCARLGFALGLWTRRFHAWARADGQRPLVEAMRGNAAMRELKFAANYERLVESVARFPAILEGSRTVLEQVRAERRRDMVEGRGDVLIHGDLWAGK